MVDPTTEPYASIERTVDLSDLRVYSSPYAPVWHEDQNGRRGRAVYVMRGAVHVNPENFALLMKDHGRGEPWTVLEVPALDPDYLLSTMDDLDVRVSRFSID